MALHDHLLNNNIYRQLSEQQAEGQIMAITKLISNFTLKHFNPKDTTSKFLNRSLQTKDPFAYFYLLAKIHKTPLTTRPIVSVSGSICHGLGKWIDVNLQKINQHLPFILSSSFELVHDFRSINNIPTTATLFTMDAISMYTNIDTTHALFRH